MVVGDIVNGVSAAAFTFQPAATVSIMLSTASCEISAYVFLTDGATVRNCFYWTGNTGIGSNTKMMINNSIYFSIQHPNGGSYSGIQIQ